MSLSSVVFPTTKNYGFYGVKDNKLVTDDNLNSLVKFFNHERAESITEENPLNCDINNWKLSDWYTDNERIEQRNTNHLEKALESKGVKPHKFPIFFGSGNMASLLIPLLSSEKNKINTDYETEFNFKDETGLRFIAKVQSPTVQSSDSAVGKHGHIVERFVTSEENVDIDSLKDIPIEIGKELTYLINSLEFPDSDVIFFSSKEFECFWNRDAELNADNACEVKAFNLDHDPSGIRQKLLVVKNFGLGRIRRLAMFPPEKNFTTISRVIDNIEKLNENQTLESFYACLNNFTKLIVGDCRKNKLTEGSVKTFRRGENRFMMIKDKDENHFWFYEYKIDSKNFSDGLKFPNSLTAIRWPLEERCKLFDRNQITNIQRYSFYGQDPDRVLNHVEGKCLLVVRKNNELANDLASKFKYKISKEDPIFQLVEEILLKPYYEEKKGYKRPNNCEVLDHLINKQWR